MKKKKSIKIKLINLFLIMGITPSLLIMLIMYIGISSNLEKQTGKNLKLLAIETSLRVDMFIDNKIANVLKYASYSTLQRLFFPGSRPESASKFVRSLFKFDADLNNLSLIGNNNKLLFSYRPLDIKERLTNNTLNAINKLNAGETLLVLNQSSTSINEFDIYTPIISNLNKKRLGVLNATINLNQLKYLIQNIPISGEYYISLINKDGLILSDTRKDKNITKISNNMINLFNKSNEGWTIGYDDLKKVSSVFGYSLVQEFNKKSLKTQAIMIYVSKLKKEAFKPIVLLMFKLFAFCIGIIFLILLIFVFRIETIWKPILSLKKGAEMIGEGNFDMVLFVPTNDELEDLAESFNKMGKNLKNFRKTSEEQNKKLIELNNVKNNFLSMVSHELRTPLMIIKEALSQIIEGFKGPVNEDQMEFLNMAFRNAGRLNQIIHDLLNISKIETGKLKFNRKNIDIKQIIQNEININKIQCDDKNIYIKKNYNTDTFNVYCDPEKVQIIFSNLFRNAIKFSKNGDPIEININHFKTYINVEVKDSGPGIPKDSLEKIFERFVRLSRTPLIGSPSTGLGLAIAKELVEMHNGKIWAESDGENGSKFCFTLPLYNLKDYLSLYWKDRINEAKDFSSDLSVFYLSFKTDNELNNNKENINKLYNNLKIIDILNPLEIIKFDQNKEIYIFSFIDMKSANVISDKINLKMNNLIKELNLSDKISFTLIFATLNVHGKTHEEMFKYIETNKTM